LFRVHSRLHHRGGHASALIEAMGRGALVLYRNTPENAEVAEQAGIPLKPANWAEKLRAVLEMSQAEREALGKNAMDRVRSAFMGCRHGWVREAVAENGPERPNEEAVEEQPNARRTGFRHRGGRGEWWY